MGRLVELTWNCQYCGSKNRGRDHTCLSCGKTRGTGTRFEMPSKITYVDKELAKKVSRNPDWLCSYCNTLNNDSLYSCRSCGASKTDSEKNYFEMKHDEELKEQSLELEYDNNYQEDSVYEQTTYNVEVKPSYTYRNKTDDTTFKNNTFKSSLLATIGLVGGIFAFVLLIVFLLLPKEKIITVTDMGWERVISIEEERTVDESDWYLPSGARLHYTNTEIHHYEDVIDHYETRTRQESRQVLVGYETVVTGYNDLGNGFAEEITAEVPIYDTEYYDVTYEEPVYRQEPVYKTKYYYEIDKWFYVRSVETDGLNKSEPYWGTVVLKTNEREQSRVEDFDIYGVDKKKDKKVEYDVNYDMWQDIEIGNTVKLKVNTLGFVDSYEIIE